MITVHGHSFVLALTPALALNLTLTLTMSNLGPIPHHSPNY